MVSPGYRLAVANAAVGMFLVHSFYQNVDLNSSDNISWKDGDVTYVLAPTNTLPLLAPLESLGMGDLAHSLNTVLQPIVESAYSRPSPQASIDASHTSTGQSLVDEASATLKAMMAPSVQNMVDSSKAQLKAFVEKLTNRGAAAETDTPAALSTAHTVVAAKTDGPVARITAEQPAADGDGTTTTVNDVADIDDTTPPDTKPATGKAVSSNTPATMTRTTAPRVRRSTVPGATD